jgi:hypothetical protein
MSEIENLLYNLTFGIPSKDEARDCLIAYVTDVERASQRDGALAIELHKRNKELETENARLREALQLVVDSSGCPCEEDLNSDVVGTVYALIGEVGSIRDIAYYALHPEERPQPPEAS